MHYFRLRDRQVKVVVYGKNMNAFFQTGRYTRFFLTVEKFSYFITEFIATKVFFNDDTILIDQNGMRY